MTGAKQRFLAWTLGLGLSTMVVGLVPAAAVSVVDTTTADFQAGAGCYVGERLNGEVLMSPTEGAEFFGAALPGDWDSIMWCTYYPATAGCPGGSVTVSGGAVTLDAARANPFPIVGYGPGVSLEFVATFGAQPFQHVGFGPGDHIPPGSIFDDPPIILFSTGTGGTQLQARYGTDINLGANCSNSTCLGQTHRYRIDWTSTSIEFFIDGVSVHSAAVAIAGPMTPAASDFAPGVASLTVDWMRMSPYGDCDYDSAIVDGGNAGADWTTLANDTGLPAGASADFFTRTGNTPSPDGTWSSFALVSGGVITSPTARYLQYRAALDSTDPDETPEVRSVTVNYTACTPSGEICDGIDNDCDGTIDNGTVGNPCGSGLPGVCGPGLTTCTMGTPGCDSIIDPGEQTEVCDGDDNDCDNSTDEGTVGNPCISAFPGICADGLTTCTLGTPGCDSIIDPGDQTETCDGEDDDCDGPVDEDTDGNPCDVPGKQGICEDSLDVCSGGVLSCPQTVFPGTEVCNNLDDDCFGTADDGDPGGGGMCTTPNPGVCAAGTLHCVMGSIQCQQNVAAGDEVCDGDDDDCNGVPDNGTSGGACTTMQPGVCGPGTEQCQSGVLNCIANQSATTEQCENDLDDDCNGSTDEEGCVCAAANTVTATTQTKITKVRLKDDLNSDKLQTKGQFTLPAAGAIAPGTEDVSVRINDGNGVVYEGILLGGSFTANTSGTGFKYKDVSAAVDGIKQALIKIKGDGVTVKYKFKSQGLEQPAFDSGTGSVVIRVGENCFKDDSDQCTLNGSGSSALCR